MVGDTCTDNKDLLKEARLSFVSGHSSVSFYIAIFLIIFMKKYMNQRIMRNVFQIGNFVMALWISITRVNDYNHHAEDVIFGSILGIICAFITYAESFVLINSNHDVELQTRTPLKVEDNEK